MIEQAFLDSGVIAIVRGAQGAGLLRLAQALCAGGIRLMEITLNTPGALDGISRLRQEYEGKMYVGAGTVLDTAQAHRALAAGAQFIVTPNLDAEVVSLCRAEDTLVFPGALTPTEVAAALRCGAQYVKVFPVRGLGPGYIGDLLAPLRGAKLVAVGGIDESNAESYIRAGAVGLGVGGGLCKVPADGDFSRVTASAQRLLAACRRGKGQSAS